MKITSNKLNTALLAIIAILLASLVFFVAVRNDNPMDDMAGHMGHSTSSQGNLTGADVMFLQMMIPHHQQAVDMALLAEQNSANPKLLDLASRIKSAQELEIKQMRNWLTAAGASDDPGHSMSGMGGMLTESEMKLLTESTGMKFDRLWLEGMIGHHDGALHMATMIEDAQNPEIKAFGEAIVRVQTAEIKEMKALLAALGK